ncbi:type II toxin-antitoxin system HicA family toxin [Paraclostridium bifermentans]|uniref:type II toxin-antitoxin system HicA family toxin n=1 Tax=Paraclostridium bifermentans TaxID=1490 RepID=UPI001158E30A|nr:type II toxin-antitoxin system HicA family toxin [Paraclostridium bifermentans]TQO55604.1 type II toxin-antitoxin system HicA family toxin [Paraclostridium bifermentans]
MGNSKQKKKTKKKNIKINYIDKIVSNVKNKSKKLKFNFKDNKSTEELIALYIDELLQSVVFDLEEYALDIQNKEFEIASEILFEQYESELESLEEVKKVINKESDLVTCARFIISKLPKKIEAIEFFSMKTYNFKPKNFIGKVVNGILDSDSVIKNIKANVPKDYFKYVYTEFFKKLEDYHSEIIQAHINKASVAFSTEVESLNRIVEETEELLKTLEYKKSDENELKSKIEKNINFIKSKNKLRGTYKSLQKFALSLGFIPDRQKGTSHLIFKKDGAIVPIPNKRGDIKPGLLSAIIKQLGSSREEYLRFI